MTVTRRWAGPRLTRWEISNQPLVFPPDARELTAYLAVCVDTYRALVIWQMLFREFLAFGYMSGVLDRRQPGETGTLIPQGRWGSRGKRGCRRYMASERQSWGWTHVTSGCHPIERAPWLDPASSFFPFTASLRCSESVSWGQWPRAPRPVVRRLRVGCEPGATPGRLRGGSAKSTPGSPPHLEVSSLCSLHVGLHMRCLLGPRDGVGRTSQACVHGMERRPPRRGGALLGPFKFQPPGPRGPRLAEFRIQGGVCALCVPCLPSRNQPVLRAAPGRDAGTLTRQVPKPSSSSHSGLPSLIPFTGAGCAPGPKTP